MYLFTKKLVGSVKLQIYHAMLFQPNSFGYMHSMQKHRKKLDTNTQKLQSTDNLFLFRLLLLTFDFWTFGLLHGEGVKVSISLAVIL